MHLVFFFNCFRKKNQALFLPMANQQRAYITSIHQSHLPLSVNKSDWQIRLAELYRIWIGIWKRKRTFGIWLEVNLKGIMDSVHSRNCCTELPLADPRGHRCKSCKLIGFCPKLRGWHLPNLENPGSAIG